jgi:Glycosyltransferase family 87/WD40-like Beta Propeller Repeat
MTTRLLALLAVALFFALTLVRAWSRIETDFPNYYTAARLVVKGEPLRNYYDWTWYQREMNFAGIDHLGAYNPLTPLSMLPYVGPARFPPLTAKRLWLLLDITFLGGTIWLLGRLTRFRLEELVLLTICAFGALRTNFLFGQYYIFLLFLLTLAFFLLQRGCDGESGFCFGAAFALKLYGGPFLLYLAVRKKRKAIVGMAIAVAVGVAASVVLFGWRDTVFYLTRIFPRSLQAGQIDPYASGNETFNTLLWHSFLPDAELNPRPALTATWLFFFLRPFWNLLIVVLAVLGLHAERESHSQKGFAWFCIAVLLLSTSMGSYTYILLLLPVALLLNELPRGRAIVVFLCYLCLTMPVPRRLDWFFPKLIVLTFLFVWLGMEFWRRTPRRQILAGVAAAACVSVLIGWKQFNGYREEPGRRFELVKVEEGAAFSGSPTVTRKGIFYQSMATDRYVLRWLHQGVIETFSFDGNVFWPSARSADGPIDFELVSRGTSTRMQLDPATGTVSTAATPTTMQQSDSLVSPDGKWVAFVSTQGGPRQIWIREMGSSTAKQVTGGDCNSWDPAWELDSSALVFASDCGRANGMPTLYRAKLAEIRK